MTNWEFNEILVWNGAYCCLKLHSCLWIFEPLWVSLFRITASWHKGRHNKYELNKLQTIKRQHINNGSAQLSRGAYWFNSQSTQRWETALENKQLKGVVCAPEIQSSTIFNTHSGLSANINRHLLEGNLAVTIFLSFLHTRANKQSRADTKCSVCCAAASEVVLVMSSKFSGFHPQ